MDMRGTQAADRMRRQLLQQHKQQEQQQQATGPALGCGQDLPARQDQAPRASPGEGTARRQAEDASGQ